LASWSSARFADVADEPAGALAEARARAFRFAVIFAVVIDLHLTLRYNVFPIRDFIAVAWLSSRFFLESDRNRETFSPSNIS